MLYRSPCLIVACDQVKGMFVANLFDVFQGQKCHPLAWDGEDAILPLLAARRVREAGGGGAEFR